VIAVRDQLDAFADATVAVVTFAEPDRLTVYRAHLDIPFPILSDPTRKLYELLGAGHGTNRQIWSLGTLRIYARFLREGKRPARPTEDIHQLGADAVIGRDGRLRYLALPTSPDRRPPIADLVAALD
jgi:hypothetical protein